MEHIEKVIGVSGAALGILATWLLGEWTVGLAILITCMVIDYVVGVMCGYKDKSLNSKIGFKGLAKKFSIVLILILAVQLDRMLGQEWIFRTLVIYFYTAMEGLSILENAAKLGVPIPGKLKDSLVQLQEKSDKGDI